MKPRPFRTTMVEVAGALSGAVQDDRVCFVHHDMAVELELAKADDDLDARLTIALNSRLEIKPFFVHSIQSWTDRVVRILGLPRVPLGHPEFDARFVVRATDLTWTLSIFDLQRRHKLLEWARCDPPSKLTFHCEPEKRYVARRRLFVRPEMIVAFVGEALAIFDSALGLPGRKDLLRGTGFRDPPSGVFEPAFERVPPVQRAIEAAHDLVRFTTLHVGLISEIIESYSGQSVDREQVERLLFDIDHFSGLIASALAEPAQIYAEEATVLNEARNLVIALSGAVDQLLGPRRTWGRLPDKIVEIQTRRRALVQRLTAFAER